MFNEQVVPFLREHLPPPSAFRCVTLRTAGMGESLVEQRIVGAVAPLVARGLEIGYCARSGEVDVRLAVRGDNALELLSQSEQLVRRLLGRHVFGSGDELLEQVVVRELTARQQTLSVAESCTGGFIAHRITNVPGASVVFWGGWVSYDDHAKQRELGVRADSLASHGAVSEEVAREMAEGARRQAGTDYALAVTGIAGPSGGSAAKPVGTVFIALASAADPDVRQFLNPYDRETFKYVTSQQALDLLRQALRA